MPYVKQGNRRVLDPIIQELSNKIMGSGDLNYFLFAFCKRRIGPDSGVESYHNYMTFIGELNESVAEIRRKLLAPYEDKKIKENGDVY